MREIVLKLLILSLSGSVLCAGVWAVTRRSRLSAPVAAFLWLFVLARFLLPLPSPFTLTLPAQETEVVLPEVPEVKPLPGTYTRDSALVAPELLERLTPARTVARPSETRSWWKVLAGRLADYSLWDYAGFAWIAGAFISFFQMVWQYARFTALLREDAEAPAEADLAVLRSLTGDPKLSLAVNRVWGGALLVGLFRPTVYLPESDYVSRGQEARLRAILLHEVTHYRRGDLWLKWLTLIVSCVHWFNPMMLLLRRGVNRACEFACDEEATASLDKAGRVAYGQALIDSALSRAKGTAYAAPWGSGAGLVKERILRLVNRPEPSLARRILAALMVAVVFACSVAVGPLRVVAQEAPEPAPEVLEEAARREEEILQADVQQRMNDEALDIIRRMEAAHEREILAQSKLMGDYYWSNDTYYQYTIQCDMKIGGVMYFPLVWIRADNGAGEYVDVILTQDQSLVSLLSQNAHHVLGYSYMDKAEKIRYQWEGNSASDADFVARFARWYRDGMIEQTFVRTSEAGDYYTLFVGDGFAMLDCGLGEEGFLAYHWNSIAQDFLLYQSRNQIVQVKVEET